MGQTIESLRKLQTVEIKIAVIRKEREARARRVESQQKLVKKAEEKLEAHKRLRLERKVKVDAAQLDVSAREDSIAKHRAALNKAKTNKEYAAILTAMNTEKADSSKIEADVLKEMEELQNFENQLKEIEAEHAKAIESLAAAEQAQQAHLSATQAEWDRLVAERKACAGGLPAPALAAFTRTAERNDGEALAAVIRLHPKRDEFACSGCNMKVTLQIVNAVQTSDDIVNCTICGRVLYVDFTARVK